MAGRDSTESRLGRIEEAIATFKEDRRQERVEQRADSEKVIQRLEALTQTVQSTASAVQTISVEKCGERLDKVEARLTAIESVTKNLPTIETEVMFWRRLLGGGFRAAWKILALAVSSGLIGALTASLIRAH